MNREKKLQARFYVSALGKKPVRDWIMELPATDRVLVGKDIQKVEFGWPIGRPSCAPLGDGLWEIRSTLGSDRIAPYFLFKRGRNDTPLKFYQENTKNAAAGHRNRVETEKGSHAMKQKHPHISEETFDAFLSEQGLLETCEDHAVKEIIAEQLADAMKAQGITKSAMANRMKTSRRQLDRLLDPATPSVTLETLRRAANAVGRTLKVELV